MVWIRGSNVLGRTLENVGRDRGLRGNSRTRLRAVHKVGKGDRHPRI
jgi:hypothetical protein